MEDLILLAGDINGQIPALKEKDQYYMIDGQQILRKSLKRHIHKHALDMAMKIKDAAENPSHAHHIACKAMVDIIIG